MLYVTTAFGVPVNVTVACCPSHTAVSDESDTSGNGITVIVIDSANGCVHTGVPDVATLTRLKTVVEVYVSVIDAVPAPSKVIVWFTSPLMLKVTTAFGVPVNVTVA